MNDLQVFKNTEFGSIRTIEIDDMPWFVGKDVADILGYSNSRKALIDHVDVDDKGATKCDTLGGKQELTIINKSGLYSLIFSSKLPAAKKFKHWVTSEVLPSIRKTGNYNASPAEKPELFLQDGTAIEFHLFDNDYYLSIYEVADYLNKTANDVRKQLYKLYKIDGYRKISCQAAVAFKIENDLLDKSTIGTKTIINKKGFIALSRIFAVNIIPYISDIETDLNATDDAAACISALSRQLAFANFDYEKRSILRCIQVVCEKRTKYSNPQKSEIIIKGGYEY
jgi:prophage antirepressor-like protein